MLQQQQEWERAAAEREASKDKRASYGVASSQGVVGTENIGKKQKQVTDNFGSWQGSTSAEYFNMARNRDTLFGN